MCQAKLALPLQVTPWPSPALPGAAHHPDARSDHLEVSGAREAVLFAEFEQWKDEKTIVHIRSDSELAAFLARLETDDWREARPEAAWQAAETEDV